MEDFPCWEGKPKLKWIRINALVPKKLPGFNRLESNRFNALAVYVVGAGSKLRCPE